MSNIPTPAYFILILAIGYAFVFPVFDELSMLGEEEQKYKESLQKIEEIENRKNTLLVEFNNISQSDKDNMEKILPNSLNYVKLISDISAIASDKGIVIDKITKAESDLSLNNSEDMDISERQKTVKSATIGFSFVSSYFKFKDFMADLEKSLRILDIKSLKIDVQENGLYFYDVEFETYWLE